MVFRVSVVTSPSRDITARSDVSIVKYALLFADRITLYSPTLAMADAVRRGSRSKQDIAMALDVVSKHEPGFPQVGAEFWLRLMNKPIVRQSEGERKISGAIDDMRGRIMDIANRIVDGSGFSDLQPAISEGLVEVDDLGIRRAKDVGLASVVASAMGERMTDGVMDRYVGMIEDIVVRGAGFPLTDRIVSSLVEAGIREGKFVSEGRRLKAKTSALSCSILRNIPVDGVPVETILEVRSEISDSAVGYREKVSEYAEFIRSEAWEQGFEEEAEYVFETKVAPEIERIERAVSSSRWLPSMRHAALEQVTTKRWATGTVALLAGLGIVAVDVPAAVVAAISMGGTLGSVYVDAVKRRAAELSSAAGNGFFLVYKADQSLMSRMTAV